MKENLYNLTNPQKSIWFTEQYYTNTPVNNILGYVFIKEEVNFDALKKAINEFVKSNDAMRLQFEEENNSCVQFIKNYEDFDIKIIELNSETDIEAQSLRLASIPFDLKNNFLFSFNLFKLPNNHGGFFMNIHHLISDSWSLGLVAKEIASIYSNILNNEQINNTYPSYLNYVEAEKEYLSSEKFNKDKEYWDETFTNIPEVASIPSSKLAGSSKVSCAGNRLKFNFSKIEINKIKDFCKENKISLYNFFMSVYSLYIGIVSNLNDFVIGTPILNRTNIEQKNTIGMFISTVPLRINLDYELQFNDFIKNISAKTMSIFRHQKYPYQYILEDLRKKDSSIPNLYNILLSYQITKTVEQSNNINYTTDWAFNGCCADELQIHLFDLNDEDSITVAYDYKIDKYDNQDIIDLHSRISAIINQVIANSNILLKDIEIVTPDEKNIILNKFNNTDFDFANEYNKKSIYNLILEFNINNLSNVALEDENDNKITYSELFNRVDKLATYLVNNCNIKNSENIGIITSKNIDTIVGILAVLKLNCTIVPIDPNYPESRKEYMISKSNINTILYTSDIPDINNMHLLSISYKNYEFENANSANYDYDLNNNLYIVFTSGSTGNPKPITITHKNMINLIMHEIKTNEFSCSNSKILQFATLSFDVSYQEIFTAFLTGSTLVMIEDSTKKDSIKLVDYILDKNIDILFIPPRYLVYIADSEKLTALSQQLKHIITAGEQLIITENIHKMIDQGVILHNHYGPAETHVATTYIIDKENVEVKPPIGKPISNSKIYILDKNLNLCPIGIPGEIYISGNCVGNGYYNTENLTNERFITDKFNPSFKMYKTGDIGKFDYNGNLYYLGRCDFQVKINGYRIEIEEVEKLISNISEVKNIAILLEKDALNKYKLCAFLNLNQDIGYEDFKEKLNQNLPKYMIPNKIYLVEQMPLNINGKVDKNILMKNKDVYNLFTSSDTMFESPSTEEEEKIINGMKKILNLESISVNDDFFELGGDSLLAISLQLELAKNDIYINTQEIYDNPSAKKLAKHANNSDENIVSEKYTKIHLNQQQISLKDSSNILLTGVTGFLGIHILNYLIENTNHMIYCVIRQNKDKDAFERIKDKYSYYFNKDFNILINKRVFVISGDLIEKNFGMDIQSYNQLCNNIDIVINTAASVKHYGNRDYQYKYNVVTIENVLDFAKNSNAILNHISTIGLAGNNLVNTNNCIKDDFSEEDLIIGQEYHNNVYLSTKLKAEQLIIDEIEKGSIVANIIRVGNLMNRYTDGMFQDNKDTNAFQNKMKELIKIGGFPENLKDFTFDITPVDLCAKAIVLLAFYPYYNNIYHVLNSSELSLIDIKNILHKLGFEMTEMANINQLDLSSNKWLFNDFILNNKKKILINSDKTQNLLKTFGFSWDTDSQYYESVFKNIMEDI